MKVLIVKVSALGDVVHALPVLPFIRSAQEKVQIDWLVEETFAPFLDDHPLVDRVHRLATKTWRKSGVLHAVKGALGVIRQLRRERYDVVLDLQGNAKSGLFTLTSGAPLRYGFDRAAAREGVNLFATNRKVSLCEHEHHITDRSLAVARAAFPKGTDVRSAGPMHVASLATSRINGLLQEFGMTGEPLVVLHYGTTWVTKHWPLDNWKCLAAKLCSEYGLRPVLTWGNDEERKAAEAIAAACSTRSIVWPRGGLPDLVALLDQANLVVGGDTGPIHIAAALGTRTVSIFRVTDARRNGPRGDLHRRLQAPLDCSPCLRKSCDRDVECGHSIQPEEVLKAVEELLGLQKYRPGTIT